MSDKKYTSIRRDDAAGRIEFKAGRAVWQWSQGQNDSTSILIKSLDNPELELERTQRAPISREAPKTTRRMVPAKRAARPADEDDTLWQLRNARGGFDPYNRG